MDQRNAELGTELVLDNRRLILGFVLLVALCGACFVIGFMEGKRQAIQAKIDAMAPASLAAAPPNLPASTAGQSADRAPEPSPAKDRAGRDQLDWYKNIQRGDIEIRKPAPKTEIAPPAAADKTSTIAPTQAKRATPPAPDVAVPAAKISYSVQVGAFRQLNEAEGKVSAVKAQGFDCFVEPPKTPDQLYLVKVGRFATRADARAMQLKLTKAGFSCFIKTN